MKFSQTKIFVYLQQNILISEEKFYSTSTKNIPIHKTKIFIQQPRDYGHVISPYFQPAKT